MPMTMTLARMTRREMIDVLDQVQHFRPPRTHMQSADALRDAVRAALASSRYGETARAAIDAVVSSRK